MKDSVLIKGNQHGLAVFINEDSDFEQIKSSLIDKLEGARVFFGANKVTLSFNGKTLNTNEQSILVDLFSMHSDLEILLVIDDNLDTDKLRSIITEDIRSELIGEVKNEVEHEFNNERKNFKDKMKALETDKHKLEEELRILSNSHSDSKVQLDKHDEVTFHYATLRSGQQVVHNHSIVIMGDVNNGARVEAGGSVIVIGKLKGVVHAGLNGTDNAYIVALDMKPVQLRINNIFGRASDEAMNESSSTEPQIAFVEDGMIAIETIDNKVLKEIRGN